MIVFKKKLLLVSAAAILSSSNVLAMNVQEALASAYEKNESMQAARQNFLIEIESFPEALGGFLPSISGEISSTTTKQKYKSHLIPNAQSSETDPAGTNRISLTQNVFAGGRSMIGLRQAQSGFWVSRTKLYNSEQEILTKALEVYLDVAASRAKYNIALDSLEFYQKNLRMLEEKLKLGEATITEVASAKAHVARGLADKSKNYASLSSAKAQFKNMTSLEANDDMTFPTLPEDLPQNLAEFEEKVHRGNLNLISASHSLKQAQNGTKASLAALLPRADLSIAAQKNYYKHQSRSQINSISTQTSMRVTIPIYTQGGADYTKIRKAKKASRQAVHQLDQIKRDIESRMIALWENYIAAKDSIDFVDKHVEYQKLALEGIRQEYEVGAKTMLDVLKTQEEYNKAKVGAVETKKSHILSAYGLKTLTGNMLAKDLKLKVKYFSPEKEFKNVKYKIFGF